MSRTLSMFNNIDIVEDTERNMNILIPPNP